MAINAITGVYNSVASVPDSLTEVDVNEYIPTVVQTDIARGYMTRYFVRQANHKTGYITEVSQTDYNSFKSNSFYQTLVLPWRISGPLDDTPGPMMLNAPLRMVTGVITANTISLTTADQTMPGIKNKVIDLTQFYTGS